MKQVILDTNFILTAVKNKIDIIEGITFLGFTPVIPIQVINELKRIVESKKKLKFKDDAKLALKILSQNNIKKIDIKNNYVDNGIINFAKQNKSAIIATMDKELKSKIPNQKLVIRAKKRLEVI
jgi:rRNA-processing protein FCF1